MFRQVLLIVISFTFMYSCKPDIKNYTIPKPLITKDTMLMIMEEFQLIEAAKTMHLIHKDSVDYFKRKYGKQIFARYRVKPSDFYNNLEYYTRDKEETNALYEALLDRLAKQQEVYR